MSPGVNSIQFTGMSANTKSVLNIEPVQIRKTIQEQEFSTPQANHPIQLNLIAFRKARTPLTFGLSDCNTVNKDKNQTGHHGTLMGDMVYLTLSTLLNSVGDLLLLGYLNGDSSDCKDALGTLLEVKL